MKSKYRTTPDKEDKTALSRAIIKYINEMGVVSSRKLLVSNLEQL
jgi:hypothetical protein